MSRGTILHLTDCDDRTTGLDVVKVPEGWSLQMFRLDDEGGGYISVILNVDQMRELQAHFLATEAMR